MKNVSRNKFLRCFRPFLDADVVPHSSTSVDRNSTTGSRVSPTKPILLHSGCSKISDNKKPPSKRTPSRVIRPRVLETILSKRASLKKRYGKSLIMSQPSGGNGVEENDQNFMLLSSTSSVSTATASSSTSKDDFEQVETKQRNNRNEEKGSCSVYSLLYLLLISLTVTVFWGRLLGVFTSTIWLFLYPGRITIWPARKQNEVEPDRGGRLQEKGHVGKIDCKKASIQGRSLLG